MKKFFVYLIALVVMALVVYGFSAAGIRLGAIPMVLIFAAGTGLAAFICKKI